MCGTAAGGFFENSDSDFEARIALSATSSGVGDVGLGLAILEQITNGDPESWFDVWNATAGELATRGEQALEHGHLDTASALARGWNVFVFDGPGRSRSAASLMARPTRLTCSPRHASTRSGTWWTGSLLHCSSSIRPAAS